VARVMITLRRARFTYASEDQLQEGLAQLLAGDSHRVVREARVSARDRVDLLIPEMHDGWGSVAIEVKVGGAAAAARRQVLRYTEHAEIGAVVLVTDRAYHAVRGALPEDANGTRIYVHSLLASL